MLELLAAGTAVVSAVLVASCCCMQPLGNRIAPAALQSALVFVQMVLLNLDSSIVKALGSILPA